MDTRIGLPRIGITRRWTGAADPIRYEWRRRLAAARSAQALSCLPNGMDNFSRGQKRAAKVLCNVFLDVSKSGRNRTRRNENLDAWQFDIHRVVVTAYCWLPPGFFRKLRCLETLASSFVPHVRRFTILNTPARQICLDELGSLVYH